MLTKSEDFGKLLIRIAVGGLLLFHGIFKLAHGVAWMSHPLGNLGLPGFIAYGSYVGEFIAPLLIILGFRTRLAALLVAFDMLMAFVLVLHPQIFVVNEGGGWAVELEAFFFLASLALFFTGGGKYSVTRAQNRWD